MITIALISICCVGIISIVLVNVFYPGQANTSLIGAVVGLTAPTLVSLVIVAKLSELHTLINSRMDLLLEKTGKLAALEERDANRYRTNE